MREFFKMSAILAFAWVMASIPVWIAFHLYFMNMNGMIETNSHEMEIISTHLYETSEKMGRFNDSIESIQKKYDQGIPKLEERFNDLDGHVRQSALSISSKLDGLWDAYDLIKNRIRDAQSHDSK